MKGRKVLGIILAATMALTSVSPPDIEVQNDSIYEESAYNNKLKVALSTGETPNIFYYPAIAGLKEWAQNGVLLDLTESLNEDEDWKNTFLDGALDTYDLSAYGADGIYALPNELNVDAILKLCLKKPELKKCQKPWTSYMMQLIN